MALFENDFYTNLEKFKSENEECRQIIEHSLDADWVMSRFQFDIDVYKIAASDHATEYEPDANKLSDNAYSEIVKKSQQIGESLKDRQKGMRDGHLKSLRKNLKDIAEKAEAFKYGNKKLANIGQAFAKALSIVPESGMVEKSDPMFNKLSVFLACIENETTLSAIAEGSLDVGEIIIPKPASETEEKSQENADTVKSDWF